MVSLHHVCQGPHLTCLFLRMNFVITMQIMGHVGMWWAKDCVGAAISAWAGMYPLI